MNNLGQRTVEDGFLVFFEDGFLSTSSLQTDTSFLKWAFDVSLKTSNTLIINSWPSFLQPLAKAHPDEDYRPSNVKTVCRVFCCFIFLNFKKGILKYNKHREMCTDYSVQFDKLPLLNMS